MYLHARHSHSSENGDGAHHMSLQHVDVDKHDKRNSSFLSVFPSMGYTIVSGCVILSFLIVYLFHDENSSASLLHVRRSNFATSTAMQQNISLPFRISPAIPNGAIARAPASFRSVLDELLLLGLRDEKALVQRLTTNPFQIPSDPDDFTCPDTSQLFDFPSIVDASRTDSFRNGSDGSWIFYQHLRKAGGTGIFPLTSQRSLIYLFRFL